MTREQIEKEYRIEHGIIQDAGKFEQQPIFTPYFHALMLDGCGKVIYETEEDYFQLDSDDFSEFPELKDFAYVTLDYDDSGFVYGEAYEQRAFYDYMYEVTGDDEWQPA